MVNFPWQAYMSGRQQDREIRQFVDRLTPITFGGLRGLPDSVSLDTTRSVITNWPTVYETPDFTGFIDPSQGEITAPEAGTYRIAATLTGVLSGGAVSGEVILFLRSDTRGDAWITADSIVLGTQRIGLSFDTWAEFNEGEVLSLALDATGNLGTLTFANASFEVAFLGEPGAGALDTGRSGPDPFPPGNGENGNGDDENGDDDESEPDDSE